MALAFLFLCLLDICGIEHLVLGGSQYDGVVEEQGVDLAGCQAVHRAGGQGGGQGGHHGEGLAGCHAAH